MKAPSSDDLGDRMKRHESITRSFLPRRSYTVLRLDGRAFHTYTRCMYRPYDAEFAATMDRVAVALCADISGTAFAYVQSDEISLLLTDFATITTQPWFDGEVQKMVSVAAGLASATLVRVAPERGVAMFDARVFTLPDPVEVENYFIWRQRDCVRNSVSMAAQSLFAHRELQGVGIGAMQEKMWSEKGVNWSDYPDEFKRGRVVTRVASVETVSYVDKRTGETNTVEAERSRWTASAAQHFSPRGWVREMTPTREAVTA